MNVQEITYQLLAEKSLTYFDSQKYVDWAVALLENGFESESLIILAGLDSYGTEEKEKYFWKSVDELNIKIEKQDFELIEDYAIFVAKQVVEGKINPMTGLNKMVNIVCATDYSSEYITFYELEEDIDSLNYSGTAIFNTGLILENKEEYVKEEFKLFLEMKELQIDKVLKDKSYCLKCNKFELPILRTKYQLKKPYKYQIWTCKNCGSNKLEHSNNHNTKKRIIEMSKKK